MLSSRWRVVMVWLALALCWSASAYARPSVLVLGRISDDPKTHYEQLKPLLDYVVPRMREVGITSGQILMARDSQQMSSYLRRGRVDWVTETAGTAMALERRGGVRPLLLTERNGVRQYRTVFFVRRDALVAGLDDLRGRTLALQNPLSTSAYLVPMMTLFARGMHPEILLSPKDQASAETVGYLFVRSERNIASFVHKRLVDAGAFSDLDWNDDRRVPPAYRRDFRVIYRSEPFPRAVEMVRDGLPSAVEARLREVLLRAADDPQGRAALARFFGTSGFYPVDPASQKALDRLRAGVARVRSEGE